MRTQIVTTVRRDVQMMPIAHSDFSLPRSYSPPSSGSNVWLIVIVFIVCIAGTVYLVARTVSPPASVKTAQLELERVQTEARLEHERKQALKLQIKAKLSHTQSKLNALEQERQAIDADFLSLCDVPLEQAHVNVSRKIVDIGLQSPKFISAYTQLLNSRFPRNSFAEKRNAMSQVSGNLFLGLVTDSHISTLDDVLIWIEEKQRALQLQRKMLDQLRQSFL